MEGDDPLVFGLHLWIAKLRDCITTRPRFVSAGKPKNNIKKL